MIKTFFKYRPIINDEQLKFALDIISNRRFYLSTINHFGDPFDAFQKKKYNFSNVKSLSLTENGDNRLLWSYYTCWYSGIMIEVELNIKRKPFENLKQIVYTDSENELFDNLKKGNCFLKSSEFKHEKEWRGIFSANENFVSFNKSNIQSITIGPSLKSSYREKIIEVCNELKIVVFDYENIDEIPNINKKTFANN
jgi:hypothetical protein